MDLRTNNVNVNFTGKREILLSLSNAITRSHDVANNRLQKHYETNKRLIPTIETYIETVFNDSAFENVIGNFDEYGKTKYAFGIHQVTQLPHLFNDTDRFGANDFKIRAQGFKLFKEIFLSQASEKGLLQIAQDFLSKVKPTINDGDMQRIQAPLANVERDRFEQAMRFSD